MSESTNGAPEANTGYLVSDLVGMALETLGVGVGGQNVDPQGMNSGVMHLNLTLAQWQRRRWLVPNLVDRAFMSTGESVYHVGPGGDLDVSVRPARIETAYARLVSSQNFVPSTDGDFVSGDFAAGDFSEPTDGLDPTQLQQQLFTAQFNPAQFPTENIFSGTPNPIDYPLTPIPSYEDYASIGLKGMRTWPSCFYYNPAFPFGEFRPWPIAQGGLWEFHLVYPEPLPTNLTASSAINLPPEYWDAILWTLAARLAPSYGQQVNDVIASQARAALNTIRAANTQIPTLGMPSILNNRNAPFWWPGLEIQRL